MNATRSFTATVLVGFLALSSTQVSFGQAPASAGKAPKGPQQAPPAAAPADAGDLVPATADDPSAAAPVQPLPPAPVQPDPAAAAQPDPAAAAQPLPAAPALPVPAAAIPPAAAQAVPVVGVPGLSLIRGSTIIGSRAILNGGIRIGSVQDLLLVAGVGEYVLVANPSGFVSIPRSLTNFDPVRRILRVNMTFVQVAELPRLLQRGQLNRQFLARLNTFFRSPRGEAILRNGIARNGRQTRQPGGRSEARSQGGGERRAEARQPGGGERGGEKRPEKRTTDKPITGPQTRTDRPANVTEARR